jgi:histidyl-tRNA synthetase
MIVETELIAAVSEILSRLGFQDFVVRINHREVLRGIMEAAGIAAGQHSDAIVGVDKLDKIGREGVESELEQRGVASESTRNILDLFTRLDQSQNPEAIVTLREFVGANEFAANGLDELDEILEYAGTPHVRVDASLARGLSYYTGTIMEINVPDLSGSLGGGGRYDGLIGMFGKEQIPACGFSLGLERILFVMDERGMFPPEIAESRAADVMVTIWNEETISESLKLADELRSQGLRVLVYPEADKLGKQIKYADSIGVPFVCVLGESELADNKVTVKNMMSGKQDLVERTAVIARIQA